MNDQTRYIEDRRKREQRRAEFAAELKRLNELYQANLMAFPAWMDATLELHILHGRKSFTPAMHAKAMAEWDAKQARIKDRAGRDLPPFNFQQRCPF